MYKLISGLSQEETYISKNIYDLLKSHQEKSEIFKRRSRLYVPLTNDTFIKKTTILDADGFIFDLEDSIPCDYKENALNNIKTIPLKRTGIEYTLRINDFKTEFWKKDIGAINHFPFDSIVIPKVESAEQLDIMIGKFNQLKIKKIVLIETIKGLWNIREIADLLEPGDALGYGAGDLSTAFGVARQPIYESIFLQHALIEVIKTAKNRSIDVFDPPYRDYTDLISLEKEAIFCQKLGTTGKQAIHPSQLPIINRIYSPTDKEIFSYVNELLEFEKNPDKQAISLNGNYKGKPSKLIAIKKLIDYIEKQYIRLSKTNETTEHTIPNPNKQQQETVIS